MVNDGTFNDYFLIQVALHQGNPFSFIVLEELSREMRCQEVKKNCFRLIFGIS